MSIGVVVIGRNEGERLRKCLESVKEIADRVVYVDSGSTDGSVAMALGMGLGVVELDLNTSFTAARARNEGFNKLLELVPGLTYVQFVDGDCEVVPGWLEKAARFLDGHTDVAVVCGRRRERFPDRSVYNMLCDIEWDTPVGEAKACGGDALMRTDALECVGTYREGLIAGEEPELCVRFRAAGWKIWRIGEEMTLHDAAMTRFGQWRKRSLRGGYAFAEGAHLHGAPPERHQVKESRRIWIWGLGIPVVTVSLAIWLGTWGLAILLIYPAQVVRLALCGTRSVRENWWRALFLVLGKFPEAMGQLSFLYNRLAGKTAHLIEYK
ncbi:glycosyl transferase [Sulfuricella sp. T08]|uniref:glycosyltransferase family 2 protein n=1 Tax=Sulfuricella sp. T08 TaxID=1632857 RepID=UPI0006179768|nr:glycosyltransferase family 2 protein [Sulfuricella sp. T08]GAO34678.1 glycosyl transferase [Sulfuricella sp. T08]